MKTLNVREKNTVMKIQRYGLQTLALRTKTCTGSTMTLNLLNKEIQVFTRYDKNGKEMDIWDVFYEQRMLGNCD